MSLLKQKYRLINANFNHTRSSGRLSPLTHRGVREQTEKKILTVVVDKKQVEEIFDFFFFSAEINLPHGGIISQNTLVLATQYQIPNELPAEK